MPTNTADQGLTIPAGADAANLPANLTTLTGQIEARLVKQYVNEADRTARNAAPTEGQLSWLQNLDRFEYWNPTGTPAWWELLPLYARKTAETQTANATTTFLSDTHLLLPVRASAVYALEGFFWWDSGTTADIKWQWLGPAGFAMPIWRVGGTLASVAGNTGSYDSQISNGATSPIALAGAGIGLMSSGLLQGIVTTGGTAGNLQLQWTQNASEAVNTRMKTNSWMRLTRIG